MKYNNIFGDLSGVKQSYCPIYYGSNILNDYIEYGNTSKYKNLFKYDITIDPNKTIDDVLSFDLNYKYKYENDNIISINKKISKYIENIFNFYGWYKQNDYILIAKYNIIDPNKWIIKYNDNDEYETMYLNFKNINYRELISIVNKNLNLHNNIFYNYCFNENLINKNLYKKQISIDPISTINQIKDFYDDIILNYDKENNIITIKRKQLNKWNTVLIMLFKFYGWYPKDNISVYPKFEIFKL